ncbi:MAG TPA: hypothetical protein VHY84_19070 [Bryobacteraceae bacterium]|jgi:hypothetical protein|nr:hypothetical protein [Bryobacteraceae bacterium]
MKRKNLIRIAAGLALVAALAYTVAAAGTSATASLTAGKAQLMSAGALAFGPDGVLFVGDSIGGAVVALDTKDNAAPRSAVKVDVQGIDAKIAALAGTTPDQIMVNDITVNPISKNVYLSASRGRGPDALPLIARATASGNVSLLSLDNIPHASVSLSDAPEANAGARQNPRMQTITDMNYLNGNVMVAGLSNEEWSSALRSIPFPFKKAEQGATLQIWHSSHGRYETQSPVRTFVPYTIQGQQYVLAAYTCTPLVKIPVSDLKPGAKVKGVTIADLGSGNQPLDMVPYKKDGHDYILVANTAFGVVKLKADNLETYKPIDSPTVVDVAGVPYDSINSLKNVQHLAQLDNANAVILTAKPGSGPAYNPGPSAGPVNIQTIALP